MGDESKTAEEPKYAKGGLFRGEDGKASGRKILGFGAAIAGTGYGAWGIAASADWKLVLVVMGLCYLLAAIMYGFLTAQNGKALIAAWKGQGGAT